MAFSYVQQANANNTASATTLAAPAVATAAGNHLFVHLRWETADTPVSVSDSAGNSYTVVTASKTTNGAHSQWFYCLNALGSGSNVATATWTAAQAYRSIRLMEFSGTSPVFEQLVNTTSAATGTTLASNAFSTASAGLVLIGASTFSSDTSASYSAGYTGLTGTFNYSKEAYRITTGALTGEVVTYTGTNSNTTRTMDILTLTEGGGPLTYSYAPTGGITFGGAATKTRGAVKTPTGGVQFSGQATNQRGAIKATSGGFLFAGTASQTRGRSVTPSGGLTLSGAATVLRGMVRAASGGILFSGAASVSFTSAMQSLIVSPVGGIVIGGAAAVVRRCTRLVSGGITFGGAASVARNYFGQIGAAVGDWVNVARHRRRD